MPLSSTVAKQEHFFTFPALLFDTCGLTWFAERRNGIDELDALATCYLLLIPTPVLFELAFGTPDKVGATEALIRKRFMDYRACIDMTQYSLESRQLRRGARGFVVLNPGFNEWWTARTRLLKHVEISAATTRVTKRDLSLDALIHAIARNAFAPICTENVADFQRLNRAGARIRHDGTVPVFHPEQALRSMHELVAYSEASQEAPSK